MHRSNEWSTTPAQADRCIAKYIGVEYQSGAVGLGWIGLDWIGATALRIAMLQWLVARRNENDKSS
jgi:hypothetical protein